MEIFALTCTQVPDGNSCINSHPLFFVGGSHMALVSITGHNVPLVGNLDCPISSNMQHYNFLFLILGPEIIAIAHLPSLTTPLIM